MNSADMSGLAILWVGVFGGLVVYLMVAPFVYIAYLSLKRIFFIVGMLLYQKFGWFSDYYNWYY